MIRFRTGLLAATVAALLAAVASPSFAGGMIGGRFGVSIASVQSDLESTFDTSNRTGIAVSGFAQLGSGVVTLQPEVSYLEKGVEDASTGDKLDLSYLEFAGLVKVGLPIESIQPHVFGGIGADFNTKASAPFDFDAESLDWNAILGADLSFPVGGPSLVLDGRYAIGLSEVTSGSSVVSDLKNRAWIFSAGLGFKF